MARLGLAEAQARERPVRSGDQHLQGAVAAQRRPDAGRRHPDATRPDLSRRRKAERRAADVQSALSRNSRTRRSAATRNGSSTTSRRLNRRARGTQSRHISARSASSAVDFPVKSVRQNLVDQLRAQKVRRDVAGHRRQLHDVAADDLARLDHRVAAAPASSYQRQSARFRRPRRRHDRRIEAVHVDRDVHGVAERCRRRVDPVCPSAACCSRRRSSSGSAGPRRLLPATGCGCPTCVVGAKSSTRRMAHAWLCGVPMNDSRRSACASICSTESPGASRRRPRRPAR